MRTILLASVVLLLNLSRASAQDAEIPPSYQHASSVDLSFHAPETPTARHAHHQQHLAQALMATSMTGHILGLAGTGFSIMVGMFNDLAPGSTSGNGLAQSPLFIGSLVTASVSLVTFFIGLGLDIDARVQLGHETSLAIGPTGVALTF